MGQETLDSDHTGREHETGSQQSLAKYLSFGGSMGHDKDLRKGESKTGSVIKFHQTHQF